MILVTGAAGYIGSHMTKALHGKGREALGLDNFINGHREFIQWGECVEADLADTEALENVFATHDITAVLHFAAFIYVRESVTDPNRYYTNNLRNTINLLDVMVRHGVNKLIFSSTSAVYGEVDTVPITEDFPIRPMNPYGRGKWLVEQVLQDYSAAHDLKYVALRYFNAAGADPDLDVGEWHEPETHLIPLVLDTALGKRDALTIYGSDYPTRDGTCIRDYIHVVDLVEAHVRALEYLENGGESLALNLGSQAGFTVREVIEAARRVTQKHIPAMDGDRNPGDPAALVASSAKAQDILGWKTRFDDLDTIVSTAWAWHQKLYGNYKK